ncbi:MAG: PepSY-associated TM helix domain-containing protein [Bacteroidota bacterium]
MAKNRFKKYIGQLHLWLGLASGIIVFMLGITGCILAFEDEISDIICLFSMIESVL